MRAGLGALGPRAAFEAIRRLRGYGFVLQPTGARQSCKRTPHKTSNKRGRSTQSPRDAPTRS